MCTLYQFSLFCRFWKNEELRTLFSWTTSPLTSFLTFKYSIYTYFTPGECLWGPCGWCKWYFNRWLEQLTPCMGVRWKTSPFNVLFISGWVRRETNVAAVGIVEVIEAALCDFACCQTQIAVRGSRLKFKDFYTQILCNMMLHTSAHSCLPRQSALSAWSAHLLQFRR